MDTPPEGRVVRRPPLPPPNLHGLKHLRPIMGRLQRLHGDADHPNRLLHYDQYAVLLLLCYFNPALNTLRQLSAASDLKKLRRKLGLVHASLGSLSEAARVFDPDLLRGVFLELAREARLGEGLPPPRGLPEELRLVAADGTLLAALPKMLWALWLGEDRHGVKLHFQFDVLQGVPTDVALTPGNGDEREMFLKQLVAGCLYLLDRGYRDYGLFQRILDAKSSFVARVQNNVTYEVLEARELAETDRAAGVEADLVVRLGGVQSGQALRQPLRLVKVHVKNPPAHGLQPRLARIDAKTKCLRTREEEYDLFLVTDRLDLDAQTVGLLYRYRWQIELFFRWFKCVLGCRHLLSESPDGIAMQVYAALIVTLLIGLWTGRKPNRLTLTMVQFYLQGWASEQELRAFIRRLPPVQKTSA